MSNNLWRPGRRNNNNSWSSQRHPNSISDMYPKRTAKSRQKKRLLSVRQSPVANHLDPYNVITRDSYRRYGKYLRRMYITRSQIKEETSFIAKSEKKESTTGTSQTQR